jgi:hypothetical protein
MTDGTVPYQRSNPIPSAHTGLRHQTMWRGARAPPRDPQLPCRRRGGGRVRQGRRAAAGRMDGERGSPSTRAFPPQRRGSPSPELRPLLPPPSRAPTLQRDRGGLRPRAHRPSHHRRSWRRGRHRRRGRTGEIKATRRRSPDLGTRTASARSAGLGVARLCRASMRGEGAPPSLALGWLDLCQGRDRRPPSHQVARFGHDGGAEAAAPPPPIPSGWPASAPRHLLRRRAAMGSRVGAGQGCRHARVGGVGERKRGGRRRG